MVTSWHQDKNSDIQILHLTFSFLFSSLPFLRNYKPSEYLSQVLVPMGTVGWKRVHNPKWDIWNTNYESSQFPVSLNEMPAPQDAHHRATVFTWYAHSIYPSLYPTRNFQPLFACATSFSRTGFLPVLIFG